PAGGGAVGQLARHLHRAVAHVPADGGEPDTGDGTAALEALDRRRLAPQRLEAGHDALAAPTFIRRADDDRLAAVAVGALERRDGQPRQLAEPFLRPGVRLAVAAAAREEVEG